MPYIVLVYVRLLAKSLFNFRGLGTGTGSNSGNISGNLSNSGLRRSDIGTGFSSGNISGGLNNSSPKRLGKGSGFGYNETGSGPGGRGFNYYSSPGGGFGYPGGLSGPPNSPSGPGGLRGPGGPSGPGGPYSPITAPNSILYYYCKVLYKDLERFKEIVNKSLRIRYYNLSRLNSNKGITIRVFNRDIKKDRNEGYWRIEPLKLSSLKFYRYLKVAAVLNIVLKKKDNRDISVPSGVKSRIESGSDIPVLSGIRRRFKEPFGPIRKLALEKIKIKGRILGSLEGKEAKVVGENVLIIFFQLSELIREFVN
ncbi:hypothetical protein QBC45DRAFT_437097 [Copromyces sp. CBS 386.78]|nr:hypothetical protein QBC45DRAFT_437097 [Copromyces sp. CBS 386.78]